VSERRRLPGRAWRCVLLAITVIPAALAILLVLHTTADTAPAGTHVLSEIALTSSADAAAPTIAGLGADHFAQCGEACSPDDNLVGIGCALLLVGLLLIAGLRIAIPPRPREAIAELALRPSAHRPRIPSLLVLSISRT